MTKQELRSKYLNLRLALSATERESLNVKLSDTFFLNVDLSPIRTIHVFLPMVSKNEPNTGMIIDRIKFEFPATRISIPRIDSNSTLTNFYFESDSQIKENAWGIPEPQFGEITLQENIDAVLVPLLAFDLQGNRLGYGKGFYDKFLHQCRPDCLTIGLSFFPPTEELIPAEMHDVSLDSVVTPSQIFKFLSS